MQCLSSVAKHRRVVSFFDVLLLKGIIDSPILLSLSIIMFKIPQYASAGSEERPLGSSPLLHLLYSS